MRSLFIALLTLCIAIAAQPPPQTPPQDKNKNLIETRGDNKIPGGKPLYAASHALIIGINKYPNLPPQNQLSYAVRDATALKDVLVKNYGFDADKVVLLTDSKATLENIRDVLSAFADSTKVGPDDRILIYFSGHGQTVPTPDGGEMGYLIPADARVDLTKPDNSGPYLSTCLPMRQIWDYLGASPAKHALVVCDACFSGLLARMRGGLSKQAAAVLLARKARMVLTAGSKGEQTSERSDLGHGVFTAKLIDELTSRAATPGNVFTTSDLYSSLQSDVASMTNGKQNPQIGSFEADGDVLFVSGGFAPPSTFADRGNPSGAVTLSVASDPVGAEIWINGVDSGRATPSDVPLIFPSNAKTAEVKLILAGYDPSVFTVNNTGANIQLQGSLTKAQGGANLPSNDNGQSNATVHVTSEPAGAAIWVNSVDTGKVTPADIEILATAGGVKEVQFSVRLAGRGTRLFRLHPTPGRQYNIGPNFNTIPKQQPGAGPALKIDPKLGKAPARIVGEIQEVLNHLSGEFISSTKQEKNGRSSYSNGSEDEGTYVRDFDGMDLMDAQELSHNYMNAFRSGLPDWKLTKKVDSDGDNLVDLVSYQLGEFEVTLEATKFQEGASLVDRATFKTGPQDRWTMKLTITKHGK